ncbi:MAG: RecX family transcriptional regulator [Bacteroidota bacterium]|nr:RecX family transcriptional regulator [Candidatus Kapabacteria bacterium]MDW8219076.1 RecX family transcriptional regulator [Bacteroidota bacterium]
MLPRNSTPPYIITSVAIQKKNKSRCSVFVNGEFAFGCTIDAVTHFGLTQGKEIFEHEIIQIQAYDSTLALKQAALHYATYKPRTAEQVRRAMVIKGYTAAEAEYAVDFLKEFGYVNDQRYARAFIREVRSRKSIGLHRLQQELIKRGISKHDIEDALADIFSAEDTALSELNAARTAITKKLRTLQRKPIPKQKQALLGHLQRQGFSWNIIHHVIAEAFDDRNDKAHSEV